MNFQNPYSRSDYIKFFRDNFLTDNFHIIEEEISPEFKPQFIKKAELIGRDKSLELEVYEIQHESEYDPRVGLSKDFFRLMANYGSKRALAIFYSPKSKNYRLSLATVDLSLEGSKVKREYSNPRRYSFFLGPDAKIKTPYEFLIKKGKVKDFEDLQSRFSIEVVTKQFYQEIANWYFWAMDKVEFPDDEEKDREKRNAKNLIRLITRIIFIWFMKEKELIPSTLFDKSFIDKIINYKDKTGSTYYKAILQNLFFATLNTKMKKDDKDSRIFVEEAEKKGYLSDAYLQQGYYRYSRFIKDKNLFNEQFENVPFLNGGLFECLDKKIDGKEIRIDCFSDNPKNETKLKVPDEIFFLEKEIEVDLSKYLDKGKNKKVTGLLTILKRYNFTIDENTPVDQDVALDPELLGKVFENLLAAYVPETSETARKATGSYYTPREIVEYMVNESLIEHLKTSLSNNDKIVEDKLRLLFDYSSDENPFDEKTTLKLIEAVENVKILDPACGSGAFPMGILHKLVLALHKLDPDNKIWKKKLLERVPPEIKDETEKSLLNKSVDYIRKLGLIENCIYGVDIQEIAIQISKLRFFISLLVEQKIDDTKPNRDIRALPNLETKFVAANTLIGLERSKQFVLIADEIENLEKQLFKVREEIFYTNSRKEKVELQKKEKKLREQLKVALKQNGFRNEVAEKITSWDPFDQNTHSDWFDPEWMFGVTIGFDIIIGNPPYGAKYPDSNKKYFQDNYESAKTREISENGQKIKIKGSLDTFSLFIEKGFNLLHKNGCLTFIVPIAITSSDSMAGLHKLLENNCEEIRVSSYAVRPQPVFQNAVVNTSILFFKKTETKCKRILSTKMYRKSKDIELIKLINNLEFINVFNYRLIGRFPKISNDIERKILDKIFSQKISVRDLQRNSGKNIYYRFAGGRYFKVVTNYSTGSSAERAICFDEKIANSIGAILSSNLFFWYYQIYSDNLNLKAYEIESFKIPFEQLTNERIEKLELLYKDYLKDIERNATVRKTMRYSNINSFREYKIGKSKHLIDKIDDFICPLYGLTKEETEFIKNYEIQFRLSDDD